jgi:hypothetical protein
VKVMVCLEVPQARRARHRATAGRRMGIAGFRGAG